MFIVSENFHCQCLNQIDSLSFSSWRKFSKTKPMEKIHKMNLFEKIFGQRIKSEIFRTNESENFPRQTIVKKTLHKSNWKKNSGTDLSKIFPTKKIKKFSRTKPIRKFLCTNPIGQFSGTKNQKNFPHGPEQKTFP